MASSLSILTLEHVVFDQSTRQLSVEIQPKVDVTYRTDFVTALSETGTDQDRIGVIASSQEDESAKYQMTGNELYV